MNSKIFLSRNYESVIDVIWYPSLESQNALLSTIPHLHNRLTFKEFRQLFKKQTAYRYEENHRFLIRDLFIISDISLKRSVHLILTKSSMSFEN
jgi:hypothetical protein